MSENTCHNFDSRKDKTEQKALSCWHPSVWFTFYDQLLYSWCNQNVIYMTIDIVFGKYMFLYKKCKLN